MKLERLYTVPLGESFEVARYKRVPRAIKILREFITRHMKAQGMKISLSKALNEHIWARSIQKPPRRVKVRLIKEDSVVRAYLADEKVEEKKAAEPKKEEKKEEVKKEVAKKEEAKKEEVKAATKVSTAQVESKAGEKSAEQPHEHKQESVIHHTKK